MSPKQTASLKRRRFIEMTALSASGLLMHTSIKSQNVPSQISLHTRLCDVLNIQLPIIQSGMGGVAGPELAAKVSNAGGLGVVALTFQRPDEVRRRIRQVKSLTTKPFAGNLLLHQNLVSPVEASTVDSNLLNKVQAVLNNFRQKLGIATIAEPPSSVPDLLGEAFEIMLEENVPILSIGLGKPTPEQVQRCHQKGIKIIAMICTVEDARELADLGVDVIVAQGSEAGGHRSTWTKKESREHSCIGTMALTPQVADAVKLPVVAAGGITDGRGLAAALALGASGVLIGTRFVATKESMASELHKKAILEASSDHTTVTDKITGAYARVIRNSFTQEYDSNNYPVLPAWLQMMASRDIFRAALEKNNPDFYSLWAGQGVGQIRSMPGAEEVVYAIASEAAKIVNDMSRHLKNG